MSEYQEFTGKTVEEALRAAREAFGASLDELDFEILTPGSRGVLGMGAEPARIIAAPRSALGGAAPRREAAAQAPLPPVAPHEPREPYADRGEGERGFDRRGPRGDRERGRRDFGRDRGERRPETGQVSSEAPAAPAGMRPPRDMQGARRPASDRPHGRTGFVRERTGQLSDSEQAEVRANRANLSVEREEIQAAEASP